MPRMPKNQQFKSSNSIRNYFASPPTQLQHNLPLQERNAASSWTSQCTKDAAVADVQSEARASNKQVPRDALTHERDSAQAYVSAGETKSGGNKRDRLNYSSEQQQQQQQQLTLQQQEHQQYFSVFHKPKRRQQSFKYLGVYDLEATCDAAKKLAPMEIIELACVLVDTSARAVLGRYQRYVRPTEHPRLTDFCVALTGIQQECVDAAPTLEAVLQHHTAWLRERGMLDEPSHFVPVTWGDWDFEVAMTMECKWRKLEKPAYFNSWVNVKKILYDNYGKTGNLKSSVEAVGLTWHGREHSGIDDACNTASLALKLIRDGRLLEATRSFAGVSDRIPLRQTSIEAIYDEHGQWNGLCKCGARSQYRVTKRPGLNHGRAFFSCGKWSSLGKERLCDFFQWVDELDPACPALKHIKHQ